MATARNNLGSVLGGLGRVREAIAVGEEARDVGLRFGSLAAAQWPAMQVVVNKMILGDPSALSQAEELLPEVNPTSQVHNGLLYAIGYMLAVQGRFEEAEPLIEESLTRARLARDAQAVAPALAGKLVLLILAGRRDEANGVAAELVGNPSYIDPTFAWDVSLPLIELGREAEWLAAAPTFRTTLWTEAGTAVARHNFVRAADVYDQIGSGLSEAWARLLAAEHGDLSQLEAARTFFTTIGATPFLRRCEAVLAASA